MKDRRANGSMGTSFDVSAPPGERIQPTSMPHFFTPGQEEYIEQLVQQAAQEAMRPIVDAYGTLYAYMEKLEAKIQALEQAQHCAPTPAKVKTQPVNATGMPPWSDIVKITCQIFHNRNLTKQQKQAHLTELVCKLEVLTADNELKRLTIATYPLKQFLSHKKQIKLSDEVLAFLQYGHATKYRVGMVLARSPGGGSKWMNEEVLVLYFRSGRPVVNLLANGRLIEFDSFQQSDAKTEGAAAWYQVWQAPSLELPPSKPPQ